MTRQENFLKAIRFETPDYIPVLFGINDACWHRYPPDALLELMAGHPLLFPDFSPDPKLASPSLDPRQRAGQPFTDDWGCVWQTTEDGITGAVIEHPLKDWETFADFVPPDPSTRTGAGPRDWNRVAADIQSARSKGEFVAAGLDHGHTFLLLTYLRGYENVLFDMADEDPRLNRLIEMIEEFNAFIVKKYTVLGVDMMGYAEDLGMQVGPMLSPSLFRKYIKPVYQRLMKPARDAGCIVHMHSDGDIRELADDLVDGGVQVLNLQDLVNGLDWIEEKFAGKVCLDLDIDRQSITPHGTPRQIDELVHEEVRRLSSRRGGLIMTYGWYPGVPLENVKALMDAMEKYSLYHS